MRNKTCFGPIKSLLTKISWYHPKTTPKISYQRAWTSLLSHMDRTNIWLFQVDQPPGWHGGEITHSLMTSARTLMWPPGGWPTSWGCVSCAAPTSIPSWPVRLPITTFPCQPLLPSNWICNVSKLWFILCSIQGRRKVWISGMASRN